MSGGTMPDQPGRGLRVARNVIGHFLGPAGWTTLIGSFALTVRWVGRAPKDPDVAIGAVIAHNEHGSITYLTPYQHSAGSMMLVGGIALFFLSFLIVSKRNVAQRTGFLAWRMTFEYDDPEGVRYWASAAGFVAGLILTHLVDPSLLNGLLDRIGSQFHF